MSAEQEYYGPADWDTLPDGTYMKANPDSVFDYRARWDYGYIVAVEPVDTFRIEHRSHIGAVVDDYINPHQLFGIWTDDRTGHVYVDIVVHVDSATDALALGRAHNQKAIWDVRANAEIRL